MMTSITWWQWLLIAYAAIGLLGQLLCLTVRDWRANVSHLIWWMAFVPVWLIGWPITSILLLTPWSGGSTWFGNYLYPRGIGNAHQSASPTYWQQLVFLCGRNPASNFGKFTLGVKFDSTWAWEKDVRGSRFALKYGWAITAPDHRVPYAKFMFRPYRIKQ